MATEGSVLAVIRASRPSFRNDHDKLAFAVHAAFLASGYALTATGKAASSSPTPPGDEEVGIDGWNEDEGYYRFVYTKTDKNNTKRKVILNCLVIEDHIAVDAVDADESEIEPYNLMLRVEDYVSNGSTGSGNYGEMLKNVPRLVDSLNSAILSKLEPPTSKTSSSSSNIRHDRLPQGLDRHDRLPQGLNPYSNEIPENPPYTSGVVYPPISPPIFNDVDPGPGAGVFPNRGRFGEGGMLVGPNDPRWLGGFAPPGGLGGVPGAPPGARFDPYGPPGVPGFEPGRFIRQPRRPGGGTHPDLEHFQNPDFI